MFEREELETDLWAAFAKKLVALQSGGERRSGIFAEDLADAMQANVFVHARRARKGDQVFDRFAQRELAFGGE